jgi:hypothetical protein
MKKVKTLDEFLLSKDSVCPLNPKVIGRTEDERLVVYLGFIVSSPVFHADVGSESSTPLSTK